MHDQLDAATGADFADPVAYARFLNIQYLARAPIEAWLACHADPADSPPPMTPLIAEDLSSLGWPTPVAAGSFEMPPGTDPIGAAWALAGSHLGNRAMLAGLNRRDVHIPTAFLADRTMIEYWHQFLPRLQADVTEQQSQAAIDAANAVFKRFIDTVSDADRQLAA
ncbi:biliverdin-producing heme oxygenase [Tsuneonella sp. HG222]